MIALIKHICMQMVTIGLWECNANVLKRIKKVAIWSIFLSVRPPLICRIETCIQWFTSIDNQNNKPSSENNFKHWF